MKKAARRRAPRGRHRRSSWVRVEPLERRLLLCEPEAPATPMYKWTFGDTRSNDYVLSSYSTPESNIGPVGDLEPDLYLEVGARYTVTVADPIDHPLQIISKAATADGDVVLLSQQTATFHESGSFQDDPGVDFVNDVPDQTISFTLTQSLADALSAPLAGRVPGYRCGNPFHRSFQRGDLILSTGAFASKDLAGGPGASFDSPFVLGLDGLGAGDASGSLAVPGETGVYRFVAPVSGTLTATLRAADGSGLDGVLFAHDGNGQEIGLNAEAAGGGGGVLSFKVTAGGVYYLEAAGYQGCTGAYGLHVSTTPLATAPVGSTASASVALDDLGASTLSGTIAAPGAAVEATFVATVTGRLTITQRATAGSPLDSLLTVFNSAGVVMTGDDDGGGGLDSRVQIDAVAGETYRVRAAGLGLCVGAFDLSVSTDDVGDTLQDAATLDLSAAGNGHHAGHIEVAGDRDLFRVVATATGDMTAELGDGLTGTIEVLDASGETVEDFDDVDPGVRVHFHVDAGSTYFVRVAAQGQGTGAYTLSLATDEPDGSAEAATPVSLGGTGYAAQTGEIGLPGDAAVYRFVATSTGTAMVTLDAIDGTALDPALAVLDASQNPVAANDDSGGGRNSRLTLPVQAGATYYIRASAASGTTGRYLLTVTDRAGATGPAASTLLSLDAANSGGTTGAIGVAGEVDAYQFVATATGTLTVRLDAAPGGLFDGRLTVLDDTPQALGRDDDGGGGYNSLVTVDVTAGRTYRVEAAGFGTSTGVYRLVIGDDFGDDPAHAATLAADANGRASQAGRIEPAGDADVFRFVAPATGTLTATLTPGADVTLSGVLTTLASSGALLAADASTGKGYQRVRVPVVAGQTYFLKVSGLGASTGSYDLETAVGPADPSPRPVTLDPVSAVATLTGTVLLPGDVGRYVLTAPRSGLLVVTQSVPPGSYLRGSLVAPDGSADPPTDNAEILTKGYSRVALKVAAGQAVPVLVSGVGASTGDYVLEFREFAADRPTLTTTDLTGGLTADALAAALVGADNPSIRVVPGSASYQGAAVASGLFAGGHTLLDSREPAGSTFDQGVVLTTGAGAGVVGPNVDDTRSGINNLVGDADLDTLVQGGTTDASVLTFQFVPTEPVLRLRYVFSSEEYDRYVGSPFNDVFGVFVNGVDYARVPGTGSQAAGTGDVVSVNSINAQRNPGLYVDNTFGPSGSYGGLNVAINGLTRVLTLVAPVVPGAVNTIKFAIADRIDARLDSAVFVQAGSLLSVPDTVDTSAGLAQFDRFLAAVGVFGTGTLQADPVDAQFLLQQAVVNGVIKTLPLVGNVLVIPVDPVDFTLTGPNGLRAGSGADGRITGNVPNAFYAGTGGNTLLILPNAVPGSYHVDLVGVGRGDFLFGASFVGVTKGVTTTLVQGNLRGASTEAVLDFQSLNGSVNVLTVGGASATGAGGGGATGATGTPVSLTGLTNTSAAGSLLSGLVVLLSVQTQSDTTTAPTAETSSVTAAAAATGGAAAGAPPAQPITSPSAAATGGSGERRRSRSSRLPRAWALLLGAGVSAVARWLRPKGIDLQALLDSLGRKLLGRAADAQGRPAPGADAPPAPPEPDEAADETQIPAQPGAGSGESTNPPPTGASAATAAALLPVLPFVFWTRNATNDEPEDSDEADRRAKRRARRRPR